MCVERGFVVNKIHTSNKKTVHKNLIWKCNVTCKHYSCRITIGRVLGTILLSTCFVKSWRNTHQTHSEYVVSVLVGFLFDMQISLIWKIQSLSVWKSSCEKFSLLAEAKCHAVWKMIVHYIPWTDAWKKIRFFFQNWRILLSKYSMQYLEIYLFFKT